MTQVIETDEAGRLVLSPELLGETKPHTRYIVETEGAALRVKPAQTEEAPAKSVNIEEWEHGWKQLQDRMSKVWSTDKSAAEIISEMRR